MRFNCLKGADPLQGDSLLFTTKSSGVPGTHFIDLRKMKTESTLEPPSGIDRETSGLGIQRPNHPAVIHPSYFCVLSDPAFKFCYSTICTFQKELVY